MVSALCEEIVMRADELADDELQSIYFGGGTPSLLSQEEIAQILSVIKSNYKLGQNPEITLEANPDDLSKGKIKEMAKGPINRLSLGIQSFFEADLQLMNRAHNASQAASSLKLVADNFENFSIDLIYGIPNMNNERWVQNIEKALEFDVPHISSYALTVEPKTALKKFIEKGLIPEVDEVLAHQQFIRLIAILEEEGFLHYEISNFGKQGYFSVNNTAYWQGKKYIGIGPSAHSYDGQSRMWNVRNNHKYIRAIGQGILPMEKEVLTIRDRFNEYVMTGLRTIWGVSLTEVENNYGPFYREHLQLQAKKYIQKELLNFEKDTLLVTKKGKFLVDGIAADLFLLNLTDKM